MTAAPDGTRAALIEAAIATFAAQGYVGGSVRLITRAAKANQAAITYHFGGKDELYRVVLRTAVAAFEAHSLIDVEQARTMDREEALRLVMRQFLMPLQSATGLARYVQIFGWEAASPSPVFTQFLLEERPKVFEATEALVRRFLPPDAGPQVLALTSFWVTQQPVAFVRNAARLSRPPLNLTFDAETHDRLVDFLTTLCLGGLGGCGARPAFSEAISPKTPS